MRERNRKGCANPLKIAAFFGYFPEFFFILIYFCSGIGVVLGGVDLGLGDLNYCRRFS